jgi:DNA polymerase-3 subunit alpha
VAEGETLDTLFEKAALSGLEERFDDMREVGRLTPEIEKTYRDRLSHEIDVIIKMGFPG